MQTIMILLPICSLMTGLITEAIKKTIPVSDNGYSKNILAGVVAAIVGIAVGIGYMILNHVPVSGGSVVYIVTLVVLSWLCAMLGFDKVKQTITQLRKGS